MIQFLTKHWKTAQDMLISIENDYGIRILPTNLSHVMTYARMRLNTAQDHKDPYDHMIIAHAMTERLTLISSDSRFPYYRRQGLKLVEN